MSGAFPSRGWPPRFFVWGGNLEGFPEYLRQQHLKLIALILEQPGRHAAVACDTYMAIAEEDPTAKTPEKTEGGGTR